MKEESNPLWKIAGAALLGIVLTWMYVRFGYTLPGIARIGETVTSEAAIIAAEIDLYNPAAPMDARRRGLAVLIGEKPELFLDIEQSLGQPFFDEVMRRKAVRSAKLFRHRDRAYDMALEKPALREMYERRHGETDLTRLKRKMLIADIARDELLSEYLDRHFPGADGDARSDIVNGVYQNGLRRPAQSATAGVEPPETH